MARKQKHEDHVNHEAWAIPYGDLVTLLFALFTVMYAMSSVNEGKFRVLSDAMIAAFNGAPKSMRPVNMGEPEPGKGGQYMAIRTSANAPTPAQSMVDHVCYTIADWNEAAVRGALKAKGIEPGGREGSINFLDPFNYYVQIASAEAENAFRR